MNRAETTAMAKAMARLVSEGVPLKLTAAFSIVAEGLAELGLAAMGGFSILRALGKELIGG